MAIVPQAVSIAARMRARCHDVYKMADYPPTASSEHGTVRRKIYLRLMTAARLGSTLRDFIRVYFATAADMDSLNNGIDNTGTASDPKWVSVTGYKSGMAISFSTPARCRVQDNTVQSGAKISCVRLTVVQTGRLSRLRTTQPLVVYVRRFCRGSVTNRTKNFAQTLQWCAAHLAVDPDRTDQLVVAGRGGAWMGTLATGSWTWQPAHNGLMVTVNKNVATDPLVAETASPGPTATTCASPQLITAPLSGNIPQISQSACRT